METFIKIQDYENYSISDKGNVMNNKTKKILKNQIGTDGYYKLSISKNGILKSFRIHRLIGIHFIPNPDNKQFIDHIDNNILNNSIENLRWATISENCRNKKKQQGTSSIYKGVIKKGDKWRSEIIVNKHLKHLGYFTDEKEAGQAYNNYIIEHKLTDFFKLNII